MPLYEYACRTCAATTDIRHGFDETNSERCPSCGGELARKFSPTGIVFKGSGFYVNDSKKSSGGAAPSEAATEKPAETAAATPATTPAPAAKADAPAPAKPAESPAA